MNRGFETAGVGQAFPRDFKSGSVVDACPDDRETHCGVDAFVERQHLERDVALVVVHGDDAVEGVADGVDEERVGRIGPETSMPLSLSLRTAGFTTVSSSVPM